MVVSIGSDHRGIEQRKTLTKILSELGHTVDDQGAFSEESSDYPDFAKLVANQVASGNADRGILVCGTGIGMCIAANKIHGIRAALANDVKAAKLSRQHNNANVLCMAGDDFSDQHYREVVSAWMETNFEGGRHERRVNKMMDLES